MLIGVSYSELGQVERAKRHLNEASRYKETEKESMEWLKFLVENDFP